MTGAPLRIVAVGDLSFNGPYARLLDRRSGAHPFRHVLPLWRGADLRLGNLESPLARGPAVAASKLVLRGAPAAPAALAAAGIDCVALANNHLMDFGPEGIRQTRAALDAAGVSHAGAGEDAAVAASPAVLCSRGQTVGVLAFCDVEQRSPLYAGPSSPGVAPLVPADAACRVASLRSRADWVVVHLHWGVELARLPLPRQRGLARELVRAGADLILGHHPHVLQPLEFVDGVPVFYSLGNFLFADMYWRGTTPRGEPFVSKLRAHPLCARTGWAEVVLQRGAPTRARLHPARLGTDLAVRPEPTAERLREWEALCGLLAGPGYDTDAAGEVARARERLARQAFCRGLRQRLGLALYHFGLLPRHVGAL
jgi:poly-gamma-glutamate capsule biosynthesis protein CapA/YwtB (metallophosphatase superfamily)